MSECSSECSSNACCVDPYRAKAQSSRLSLYAQHQSRSRRQNQLYKIHFWCLPDAGQMTELRDLLLCISPSLGLPRDSTSTPLIRLTLVIRTRQTQPRMSFHSHFLRSASSFHHFTECFQYPGAICCKACLTLHQYLSCFHRYDFAIDLPLDNI